MVDAVTLGIFLTATLVIMITPGPDMLYVLARTFGQGRRAGLISVLGIAGGILVHTAFAAFGLSRLIATMPFALTLLRYFGAAYLIFLAYQSWRSVPAALTEAPGLLQTKWFTIWRTAFFTNILNPKALIFFLAFLPQFSVAGPDAFTQMLFLGLLVVAISILVNGALCVLVASAGRAFTENPRVQKSQRWVAASVFAGLAVRILV